MPKILPDLRVRNTLIVLKFFPRPIELYVYVIKYKVDHVASLDQSLHRDSNHLNDNVVGVWRKVAKPRKVTSVIKSSVSDQ